MADNVAITAGSGTTIAADDVGAGVLVQRVKATWGPDGTANDTDVASGKPLPVQIRQSNGTEVTPNANGRANAADSGPVTLSNEDLAAVAALRPVSYETVAASQTDQVMGPTGATGDYLDGVLVVPASTSPGAVSIKDGSGSAITIFAGGANSVLDLRPQFVPLGAKSGAGAWKLTTGANVSAIGIGNFT